MNKGTIRIIVGAIFIILGGSRFANDTGGLQMFGAIMALYGLFSVGYGIHQLNLDKDKNQHQDSPEE